MSDSTTATESFIEQFGELRPVLPGAALPWLSGLRETAIERFSRSGLPTPRVESWKYTSLRHLDRAGFRTLPGTVSHVNIDCAPTLLSDTTACHRLVFIDGHFDPALSTVNPLPEGAVLDSLGWLLASEPELLEPHLSGADGTSEPLVDLNSALMNDGFALILRAGTVLHEPIEIVHLGGTQDVPVAYHPRNLIVLEEGCQATLVENHRGLGDGAYFTNLATQCSLGDGALLRHYKLQNDGPGGFHLSNVDATVGRDASYDSFTLSIGARLSRNAVQVRLAGEGGECHLNGAYLMRGEQHCDNTTQIDHLVPHTTCRETFKGVIDDRARAVFQGRIVVHKDAQKTNGHQLSKALLLSDRAEIDQKPELEIYADDVLCSHGATAGDLDHDALFYLRSRGIPEAEARSMLIEAFLAEAINAIAAEGLCPALMTSIGHWLAHA